MTDAPNLMPSLITVLPFWVAFLVSAVVAYPVYRLLLKLKSRQTVSQHAPEGHQVKQGTPTMGGIIIVLGALAASVAGAFVATYTSGDANSVVPGFFLSSIVLLIGFAVIGFVDDFVVPRMFPGKRGLGWKQKILMQVVLAIVATGLMLGWTITFQAGLFVFLILFCANAYNFLDGLDSLAGSVLIALCGGLILLQGGARPDIAMVLAGLIGATIPFLFLNAPPAKVFMGDVGSLPIGAVLGLVFSLLLYSGGWTFYTPYSTLSTGDAVGHFSPSMILPLLVIGFILIAELVPVPLQIFSVKVFKRKIFLYTPIHHAFEKKGWKETRVVWSFLLAQLLLCVLAYTIAAWPLLTTSVNGSRYHYYYFAPELGQRGR